MMHKIVLQWKGHFLLLNKPIPLVMSRVFWTVQTFLKKLKKRKKGNNLLYSQNHRLAQAVTEWLSFKWVFGGKSGTMPHSYTLSCTLWACRRRRMRPFHQGSSQCHWTQQHLNQGTFKTSPGLSLDLERSIWKRNKKPNKIRNKQRTTEENKPPKPLEWLPWIITSQAGLNLLDVLIFGSEEAFGTYLKLKWWAVKALAGTGISSAYVSALFLVLTPASCLPISRVHLGRVAVGESSFYCDPTPATATPFNTCPFLLIFQFYQSNGACDRLVNN